MTSDPYAASTTFQVREYAALSASPILDVLSGRLTAVIFRRHASAEDCEVLMNCFRDNPMTRERTGDATGYYLGSFHWGKTLDQYQTDCRMLGSAVSDVLGEPSADPWGAFVGCLDGALRANGGQLRPARLNNTAVVTPLIREWTGRGEYSLVPHDDQAQCSDPSQQGFEIQRVNCHTPCSVNLCIANAGGGNLIMWNYKPSVADRVWHGTSFTGGPYKTPALRDFPTLDIEVNAGDLYIFNGALVHAVAPTHGSRATISSLMGRIDDRTVVLWT
jgi:hypothetical protein